MLNVFSYKIIKLVLCLSIMLLLSVANLIQVANAQWIQSSNGMGYDKLVRCLFSNDSNLYAGTTMGIFRSSNGGINWDSMNTGLINHRILALASINNDVYTGTENFDGSSRGGLFKSTNNGNTWDSTTLMGLYVSCLHLIGVYKYVGTYYRGIYRSSNNGLNWIQMNTGLTNLTVGCIAELGGNIFIGTNGSGVFVSSNNGNNWSVTGLNTTYVNSIVVLNNSIFAGTNSGVYRSTNFGVNWSVLNNGFNDTYIWSLVTVGNNILAGTQSAGVYLSTNNGDMWIEKSSGFNVIPPVLYLSFYNNYLYAATDGKSVWKRLYSEIIVIRKISSGVPGEFSLMQNFPNPFNSVTKIRFNIPENVYKGVETDAITIKIFDVLGREIKTLVNEKLYTGRYEVTFDGSLHSSGIYLCILRNKGYFKAIRIILKK